MKAQELKHVVRLAEWKERVAACRSSGLSVRAWCREQGVSFKTYYYWEKAVLAEAGQQLAVVESGAENRFVEVPALPGGGVDTEKAKSVLAAKLRTRLGELEVYAGADAAVVAALVQVLKDAE